MRHGLAGNRLGRNSSLRKATMRDLAKATLIHERICTTKAKAKEARKLIDRLITLGKRGTLACRRRAFAILCDHQVVSDLFKNTAPRFKARPGGYTRIIPLSTRQGDRAQLAYLELTEKTEIIVSSPKPSAKAKVKEAKSLEPRTEKITAQSAPAAPETHETRKEKAPKAAPPPTHPKQDMTSKDKLKTGQKIMGGFKKMFTKKPSE